MPIRIVASGAGVTIAVKVVPGASRDRIVGELGEELKIAVSKPPQGGAANDAVIKLLSRSLGLPARQLTITHGHANPRKQILIQGMSADEIRHKLGF